MAFGTVDGVGLEELLSGSFRRMLLDHFLFGRILRRLLDLSIIGLAQGRHVLDLLGLCWRNWNRQGVESLSYGTRRNGVVGHLAGAHRHVHDAMVAVAAIVPPHVRVPAGLDIRLTAMGSLWSSFERWKLLLRVAGHGWNRKVLKPQNLPGLNLGVEKCLQLQVLIQRIQFGRYV